MTSHREPGRLSNHDLDSIALAHLCEIAPEVMLATAGALTEHLDRVEKHMEAGATFEHAWEQAREEDPTFTPRCSSRKHVIENGQRLCDCGIVMLGLTAAHNARVVTLLDPSHHEVSS